MRRLDPDAYYVPSDEAMRVVGTTGHLANLRCQGRGPAYVKHGARILYRGSDVNAYLDACRVVPATA